MVFAFIVLIAACGDAVPESADDSAADTVAPASQSPGSASATTTSPSSAAPDSAAPEPAPPSSTTIGTTAPPEPAPPDDDDVGSPGPPTTLPERVPPTESPLPDGPVDTSAVPGDLMDSILADAASRIGVPTGDLVPVKAAGVVWNDGSLGCPKPGESYTQALVNGYWVIVVAGDRPLDYRASSSGFFFLCLSPGPGGNPTE